MQARHHCELAPSAIMAALRTWYASRVGEQVADELQRRLDAMLPGLFGFHALQLGNVAPGYELLAASQINHTFRMDYSRGMGEVLASAGQLPFDEDSLDLVVMPHTLEFAAEPHRILREVDRALIPEGHIIIVGFNPASFYGLWRLFQTAQNRVPWCGRFYTAGRVQDWLSLLSFDVLDCSYIGFRPPIQNSGVQRRLRFMESAGAKLLPYIGGVFIVLARNKVSTLTPLKPSWRSRASLLPGKLAEPTTRGHTG